MAVRDDASRGLMFVTIPPGSTVILKGDVQRSGLVDVLDQGRIVGVFMRDIEERAEVVEDISALGPVRRDDPVAD